VTGIVFFSSSLADMPVIDMAAIGQAIQEGVTLTSQLAELQQHTEYLKAQAQLLNPSNYDTSTVNGLISGIQSAENQYQGISSSAANAAKQFQTAFPGYKAPDNYGQQYQSNVNTALNTLVGTVNANSTSSQDIAAENERLEKLKSQAQGAEGQTQVLQILTEISTELAEQTELLRETILAQSNAASTYYAMQIQKEASQKAVVEQFINSGSTTLMNYGESGDSLQFPTR
jgi:P-type conjugative transfer protein TrbJ